MLRTLFHLMALYLICFIKPKNKKSISVVEIDFLLKFIVP